MVCILNIIPHISLSLFSAWFSLDSQSAMYRSDFGLYVIHILYRCILSKMNSGLCDNVAASFLHMKTRDL